MRDKLITTNIDSGVLYVLLERRYWSSRILVFQVSFVVNAQHGSRRRKAMFRNVLQASGERDCLPIARKGNSIPARISFLPACSLCLGNFWCNPGLRRLCLNERSLQVNCGLLDEKENVISACGLIKGKMGRVIGKRWPFNKHKGSAGLEQAVTYV